jgi:peptidoglycan hydrolase-like protein with peptidoglycan-binding domain
MGRRRFLPLLLFGAIASSQALAQNAGDMFQLFSTMMRAAIVESATAEWRKVPQAQVACINEALQQQAASIGSLIQQGISPADPRLAGLRSSCRTVATAVPVPSQRGDVSNISGRPSFNCAKATRDPIARVLCLDQAGANADWDLVSAYWARMFSLPESARGAFDRQHEAWWKAIGPSCGLQPDQYDFPRSQITCVHGAYAKRASAYRRLLSGDALRESRMGPEQRAEIQERLRSLGLFAGETDAEFGRVTRTAIRRFQSQRGYPEGEFLTVTQQQALFQEVAAPAAMQSSVGLTCTVADPSGSPLNIRATPAGDLRATIPNGRLVDIVQNGSDDRGRPWSLITNNGEQRALGWVYQPYLNCGSSQPPTDQAQTVAQAPAPAAVPRAPEPPKDTPELRKARLFLDDARTFIASQQAVSSISSIASEAANLQLAITNFDEASALRSMKKLGDLLKPLPGFSEFVQERTAERDREQQRQLAESTKHASRNIYFIDGYMRTHLGDEHTPSLLKLRERLSQSISKKLLSDLDDGNTQLEAYVEQQRLSNSYEQIVRDFRDEAPASAPQPSKPFAERLSAKTRFVAEGQADEIILLFNATSTALCAAHSGADAWPLCGALAQAAGRERGCPGGPSLRCLPGRQFGRHSGIPAGGTPQAA